ncbi:MAG: hypothetical protein JGK24_33070 [Microcoleus sp. PH2017_29_MFU_D_A]|nr:MULTISPECIES: hypothetical protein [unclassified Microcoleus]MCC3422229.1 hypothetical protein [Microcoleus sp. PH2017_07_MST_O_A]MCC3439406.1 hypothetical protein [Microcoleus sp. PH2017_05_CCC_O_A]MCC3501276.1 hypothetical protein [Microcoleus sp. PH2017_15_JOR_U_A]MCC3513868.1 hypothetical protein [Microcoleus sp. PH2017_17_BER_D_A]MCC3428486.1 hypothetical protein [Microcoleus sp. PH2017_01_SCD_O_A]
MKLISHFIEQIELDWRNIIANTSKSKFNNTSIYYCTKAGIVLDQRPTTGALAKHIVRFASKWEYRVYRELVQMVGVDNVGLQSKIILKDTTGNTGRLTYVCDFLVYNFFYVEAKGFLTPEARCKLKVLELLHPSIAAQLLIVTEKPQRLFGAKCPPTLSVAELTKTVKNFEKYRIQNNDK